jgi:transmembrane sensor
MSETTSRAADTAAARVHVEWSEDRARAVERAMFARKRRRAQTRAVMAVVGAVIAVLSFGVAWKRLHREAPAPVAVNPPAAAVEGESITFADGSVAAPLDKTSLVKSKEVSASKIDVELVKGSAHFEVSKNPERVFRVEAGTVTVEVLGTGFTVERLGDGARVAVDHGRVKVQWNAGSTILGDGQGSTFPPVAPAGSATIATGGTEVVPAPSATIAPSATVAAKSTWKALAHDGEFDKAYAALKVEGGATAVHDDAGELLLAADVARLSHHPADAVVHLRRVVSSHSGDPRAPLAAFTLGRVLLEELGQPGQAAEAFAKARALGGAGPLAEDALAREVEAWWRAGATDKAHERAEEYVKLYPKGLRIRSVKKYGGLEE